MEKIPQVILRRYEAKCELAFNATSTFLANCEISLSEDGDTRIECKVPSSSDFVKVHTIYAERHLVYASLIGEDSQGFNVNVPRAYILQMGMKMSGGTSEYRLALAPAQPLRLFKQHKIVQQVEVHYGLSNFYFGGCEVTHTETGSKVDKFRVKVQNLDLLFKQLDDYDHRIAMLKQDGGIVPTSELIVRVEPDKLEELDTIVFDVLVLLSYATGSWIGVVYRDIFVGADLTESRFGASKTFPYKHFDFVIDARNLSGCQLRHFAERAFPNFLSLKHSLSLDIVLEFAATAKLGSHLETKYILTSLALETLASCIPEHMRKFGVTLQSGEVDIARSKIAQILNKRGCDISSEVIDEIADKVAFKGIGLKDRLRALLNQYGIAYDANDLEFTRTRARLIHSGRFDDYTEAITLYQHLTDFVNRILLSLLGCQGIPYVNVAKGYTEQPVPPPVE